MNVGEVLKQALAIRGVTAAAVARDDGALIESHSDDANGLPAEILAGAFASGQLLASATGDSEMLQAVVELSSGPLLLLSLKPEGTSGYAVIALDSMSSLGRVRLQLKKLLPELAKAVTA